MIGQHFIILGKGSFAISIIIDILSLQDIHEAGVISNIPDSENDSLAFPYQMDNFNLIEYDDSNVENLANKNLIIGSIGKSRRKIYEYFSAKIKSKNCWFNVIHPSAVISSTVKIGNGIHISPLSVVAPFAIIDDFVVVNRQSSIGHHTHLEEFVTINPGVTLTGKCHIGGNTTIGAGAVVMDSINIGKNTIIGAGSVVTKDIPDNVIAYGSPAKVIRNNSNFS